MGEDFVRSDVRVITTGPAPFRLARQIAALLLLLGAIALVPLVGLGRGPYRIVAIFAIVASVCIKVGFPRPTRREQTTQVRVSANGITVDGQPAMAKADVARAIAMSSNGDEAETQDVHVEHREAGRHITIVGLSDEDAIAMLEALGFSSASWRVRLYRQPGLDFFSTIWRLFQFGLVLGSLPLALMESLEGWGFVAFPVTLAIAIMWGREMRIVDLTIDDAGMTIVGMGTNRRVRADRIGEVSLEVNRVDVAVDDGDVLRLFLVDDSKSSRRALATRLARFSARESFDAADLD